MISTTFSPAALAEIFELHDRIHADIASTRVSSGNGGEVRQNACDVGVRVELIQRMTPR